MGLVSVTVTINDPAATRPWSSINRGLLVAIIAAGLMIVGIQAGAAEPTYRFVSVRTILGPCCTDTGNDIVVDIDDGVFVVGRRGGLDLDRDGRIDVPTHGSPDSLVLKAWDDSRYDREFGWVAGPGGPDQDFARAVALDGAGGAFVVGYFKDRMYIGDDEIESAGAGDGFLARYDRHGEVLWSRAIGTAGEDDLMDVAADSEGNVYVTGVIGGALDIDGDGIVDATPAGGAAMLLASFEPGGGLRWFRLSGGADTARGLGLAIGPKDEVYVSGFYHGGRLDLDGDGVPDAPVAGGAGVVNPQTDLNGYFARFDTTGEMQWIRIASGPAVQIIGSLAIAGNGDLIVSGGYTDHLDLDGDGVTDLEFTTLGDSRWKHDADGNTFLLKVTSSGERIWARRYLAAGAHVTADATRIVLSGSYDGPLDLDGDGVIEREADDDSERESFIAILDGEGALIQVFTIVGGDSDVVSASAFSPDGTRLYATGYNKLGADFDGDGRVESASLCHQLGDLFVAVYDVEDR